MEIYGDRDPNLLMGSYEHTCFFLLDTATHKFIKPSWQFQHKNICKDYKDAQTIDKVQTRDHVIRSWWLSFGIATEEGIFGLSKLLGFGHFRYMQWGGHMLIVN